jgi:hypothetical protein
VSREWWWAVGYVALVVALFALAAWLTTRFEKVREARRARERLRQAQEEERVRERVGRGHG